VSNLRRRALVVPAAGRGSRLGGTVPKALVEVAGRPMIGWLIALYRPWVSGVVVVAHPTTSEAIRDVVQTYDLPSEVVVQAQPTGMLDAVRLGCAAVARWSPERVWITWCDQIAVHPDTVARLADQEGESSVALALLTRDSPYIHFDRAAGGGIVGVRQRREGDVMPARGDSDIGLFSLAAHAAMVDLPAFATTATPDAGTGERNFLPFIPHAAARRSVVTIPATEDIEAVGVNTPDELARVEAHLKSR
jgi:bifunctional UDP-N-acetylglucosamine pyrophosphorylase / glucosamine-1-phosphate N-acetyltransferase